MIDEATVRLLHRPSRSRGSRFRLKGSQGDARVGLIFGAVDHVNEPPGETPAVVQVLLTGEQMIEPIAGLVQLVHGEGFALVLLRTDQLEVQTDGDATVLADEAVVVTQMLHCEKNEGKLE